MRTATNRGTYVLITTDKDGVTVRFTKRAFDKHKNWHPELLDSTFLPDRIVITLQKPHLIMPDYANKNAVCYYYQEFGGSAKRYTKVVVDISKVDEITKQKVFYIKTAYRPDNIKERKYKLKAIYNDSTIT